jgi:sialic acid synthase SpsE
MVNELKAVDTGKHEIIIKWQLFKEAEGNIPLNHSMFCFAYDYAKKMGYKTTSSVFDLASLKFLLNYDIPFVKIANRRDLDWIIGEIPRGIPVYISYKNSDELCDLVGKIKTDNGNDKFLQCVSKYPATIADYDEYGKWIGLLYKYKAISDHAIGLDLYKKYQPHIWEKHYKLSDSQGLDAGSFAITPAELREIL